MSGGSIPKNLINGDEINIAMTEQRFYYTNNRQDPISVLFMPENTEVIKALEAMGFTIEQIREFFPNYKKEKKKKIYNSFINK